jgi:hypothetical protein
MQGRQGASMPRGSSLLLGNGINNLSNTYSWKDLIRGLVESCNGMVAEGSKPFPLLYEEIVSRCLKRNEKQLINSICDDTKRLRKNSWHANVLRTGIERILTTNYDYLIETSSSGRSLYAALKCGISMGRPVTHRHCAWAMNTTLGTLNP